MATTIVEVTGNNSPEYIAIRKTTSKLHEVLGLDTGGASRKLFEACFIVDLQTTNTMSMIQSVLKHVEKDAIHFYKFLKVVQALGNSSEVLYNIHEVFVGEIQKHISARYSEPTEIQKGSAFLTFSRRHPERVNSRVFTGKLYKKLETARCNPWMDAENLDSGDYLSTTIYKTLDECKAVVPIVTKGYAQSLWCMRELYYAISKQSIQIHAVVIEDGWEREDTGKWLESMLKQRKMHLGVNPTDEKKMADIASQIAKSLGVSNPSADSQTSKVNSSKLEDFPPGWEARKIFDGQVFYVDQQTTWGRLEGSSTSLQSQVQTSSGNQLQSTQLHPQPVSQQQEAKGCMSSLPIQTRKVKSQDSPFRPQMSTTPNLQDNYDTQLFPEQQSAQQKAFCEQQFLSSGLDISFTANRHPQPSTPNQIEQCTYYKYGKELVSQVYYTCSTCWGVDVDFGCCKACASSCHKGHRLDEKHGPFYCDCGDNNHQPGCTRNQTGQSAYIQHFYRCHTCFSQPTEGVCYPCAVHCHGGHNTAYVGLGNAFCDCGLSCRCNIEKSK